MLLYHNVKKYFAARVSLPQGREKVDVSVLHILAAALLLVISAAMLVYGAVKDYRAEKLKAAEMVPAVVSNVPLNMGQGIQQMDVSSVPPRPAHQQEQSKVTGTGSRDQTVSSSVSGKQEKITKPVSGTITVGYGWREHPVFRDWRFHSGIDIEAPVGTEVKAALSGKVKSIKREHKEIIVKTVHESGITIVYGNLQKCYLETDQIIARDEIVGVVGETSPLQEKGLHFEVWQDNKSVDPQSLIEW
jgi:murein DD-endopeptidase MepM/ murein hydrolase activator NlpD